MGYLAPEYATKGLMNKKKYIYNICRNPSLGLVIKATACNDAGQEGSPGVTSHASESVRECEGTNLHTYK